jgi:hypothetical protein
LGKKVGMSTNPNEFESYQAPQQAANIEQLGSVAAAGANAKYAPPPNTYDHYIFNEADDPELAKEAWKIHADGHLAMGFVNEKAVTDEGFIVPDIDKARGPDVKYFLAINPENPEDRAAVRKVPTPPGGSYRDLPSYGLCENALSEEGEKLLAEADSQGRQISEIIGLARTADSSPMAIYELFRAIVHDGAKNNEIYFFSIVAQTHESLVKSFGEKAFEVIGEDLEIPNEGVEGDVRLKPVYCDMGKFIENVRKSYQEAENPAVKRRLQRSFSFLTGR